MKPSHLIGKLTGSEDHAQPTALNTYCANKSLLLIKGEEENDLLTSGCGEHKKNARVMQKVTVSSLIAVQPELPEKKKPKGSVRELRNTELAVKQAELIYWWCSERE